MSRRRIRSSGLIVTLIALAAAALPATALEPLSFDDPAKQARYDALLHQLRCVVCQNESLASSDAGIAGGMRRRIHRMIAEGRSNAEIKAYLTSRYGDFVLYRPPMTARTYALWFGPPLLALIGAAALVITVRRRNRSEGGRIDADDRARLRAVLDRHRNDAS